MAAHVFFITQSMRNAYFCNADGELLIVPQQGELEFFTEFGRLQRRQAKSASSRAA